MAVGMLFSVRVQLPEGKSTTALTALGGDIIKALEQQGYVVEEVGMNGGFSTHTNAQSPTQEPRNNFQLPPKA